LFIALFKKDFYPRELAKLRGYTSCCVVAVAVAVVAVLACLLVFYSSTLYLSSLIT
jgi:hypothetical protein